MPAVISRLAGLGYTTCKAHYLDGELIIDYLDDVLENVIARREVEDDIVRILYDRKRHAIGVISSKQESFVIGLADLYRALQEISIPEPLMAELIVSYVSDIVIDEESKVEFQGLKLKIRGKVLLWGDPQGKSICVLISPLADNRSLITIAVRGEWGFTINALRNMKELMNSLKDV